jgi:hypothetical protein
MSELCWDCQQRKGVIDAVDDRRSGTSVVYKLCTLCTNRWRRYMRKKADYVPNSEEWTTAW